MGSAGIGSAAVGSAAVGSAAVGSAGIGGSPEDGRTSGQGSNPNVRGGTHAAPTPHTTPLLGDEGEHRTEPSGRTEFRTETVDSTAHTSNVAIPRGHPETGFGGLLTSDRLRLTIFGILALLAAGYAVTRAAHRRRM